MQDALAESLPDIHRDAARAALTQILGGAPAEEIVLVTGGSTGAALFRVRAKAADLLLRIEGPATAMLKRNPHRFSCMQLAAEAGLAPRVHYVEEASGVTVTDFIEQQPLSSFPGGEAALAKALGEIVRRLQQGPAFPPLVDYRDLLSDMLTHLAGNSAFAAGLFDAHLEALSGLRASIDWDPSSLVASHNDPNPNNILFDGQRLWLIDWETAYRNDPFIDLAIVSDSLAASPELTGALLGAWRGVPADEATHDRLRQTRRLTRLYYACFLLAAGARQAPVTELTPRSPADILEDLQANRLARSSPGVLLDFGKIYLDGFLTGALTPGLREAGAAAF